MNVKNKFLVSLAKKLLSIDKQGPLLVGIDGVDGSGKTHFATELTSVLESFDRSVLHSSIDYFHNPRIKRYPEGKSSAESFFEEFFNYHAVKQKLLDPLKF